MCGKEPRLGQPFAAERNDPEADAGELSVGAARNATTHRLMDSLLHDVRNPLNALSINLDVLIEKLRREQGEIPPSQEKNLKVMREQIHRVDGILRQYLEFIAPRPEAFGTTDLSEATREAIGILGHECRKAMVRLRQLVEPDLRVDGADLPTLRFLVMQLVFRAVIRAGQQGEVEVTLQREEQAAVLRVRDGGPQPQEPFEHATAAVERLCARFGAQVRWSGSECVVSMPLTQEGQAS
jgi:signal transduction histidine kinase